MRMIICGLVAAMGFAAPAMAQPGMGEAVYGAILEPGVTELETRYGRIAGGAADGEDAMTFELAHTFSRRFYGGVEVETARAPGDRRQVENVALEGIAYLGHIDALNLDAAIYGEYGFQHDGPNSLETKLLLEHRQGNFDGRFDLIVEKPLGRRHRYEKGYAASADWAVIGDDLRLGAEAFGSFDEKQHFLGPILKTELERLPLPGELEVETGYLFALTHRDEGKGQARLLLEYEFHL